MRYEDFKIRIASVTADTYRIIVESPMGSAEADLELPFRLTDLEGVLLGVADTVRGSSAVRDLEPAAEPGVQPDRATGEFGVGLYRAVFRDTVQSMLDQCLGSVRSMPDTGLRIRLEMDLRSGRMADVASLPWELMRRDIHEVPLSVSKRTTVVRSFDVMKPSEPIPFKPPLRVLVIVSNPGGTTALKLEEEERRIRSTWGQLEQVEVYFVKPTVDAMLDACAAQNFHVIHYMGHGDFDPVTGQGILFMEKPDGSPDPLKAERLKALFQDESDTLRLVFLNACKTAVSSERKGLDPFAGIATMLIDVGVPAVVAMQFPITDNAAITFSDTFYRRIVAGYPVDAAVAEGRKALWVEGNPYMEWATPVLFMRSRDGVLFTKAEVTVEPIPEKVEPPPPPPPPAPAAPLTTPAPLAAIGRGRAPVSNVWWMAAGGVVIAALFALWYFFRPPPVPFVTELSLLSAPDSVYEDGEDYATLRAVADDLIYDGVLLGSLFPDALVAIEARSDSFISAVFDEETGEIIVRGERAGMASLWAVALLPDGDSIVTERHSFAVRVPPGSILAGVEALDRARQVDAGGGDDAGALEAYLDVRGSHAGALGAAGRLEGLDARVGELRGLIALRDSTDRENARADLTLAEKRALDAAYLARSAELHRSAGSDHAAVAARMAALDSTMRSTGSVTRIVVCDRPSSEGHCTSNAEALQNGRLAYATVGYVGREAFTIQWFRDGQQVASEGKRSDAMNANGYRVTFQRTTDAPGAWEVRVTNAAGHFVARQAFRVQ